MFEDYNNFSIPALSEVMVPYDEQLCSPLQITTKPAPPSQPHLFAASTRIPHDPFSPLETFLTKVNVEDYLLLHCEAS